MKKRLPATAAPGLLEPFSAAFDPLFSKRNQRDVFRQYMANLLLPTERNKTLTALANTEPVVGAQQPRAQQQEFGQQAWKRLSVYMAYECGLNRATSRLKERWVGPNIKYAPSRQSDDIGRWCAALSGFAGGTPAT